MGERANIQAHNQFSLGLINETNPFAHKIHTKMNKIQVEWKQSGILCNQDFKRTSLSFLIPYIEITQLVKTCPSPQVLSSSSAWVPAFRGRGLWCTPTIPLKDSRLNETNSMFWHGTTQQEGRMTLISSALWTSRQPGPMNTTLDVGKTLTANGLQAMSHI